MTPSTARRCALALAALLPLAVLACASGEPGERGRGVPGLTRLFRVDSLERPESVAWDGRRSRWLISNIVGGSSAEDGNGYLSAVSRRGDAVRRKALTGESLGVRLDGPKGIDVSGSRAYVADIHRVVGIDLAADTGVFALEIGESGFLNDVAVGDDGDVYVSDTEAGAVYRVEADGSGYARVGAAGSLRGPNGLIPDPGGPGLVIAGWEGALLALRPDSSVVLLAEPGRSRSLDGVQPGPGGTILFTDYGRGTLQALRERRPGAWTAGPPWLDGLTTPADFLYRDSVVALPELDAGRVTFYRVAGS